MTTTTHRFEVRGIKIKTRTPRRFIVVSVRPKPYFDERRGETYAPFAEVIKRTDAIATARATARRYGFGFGCFAVVIDATTGEEVSR